MIGDAIREDGPQIHSINANTAIFSATETATVDEMLDEALTDGFEKSGYHFIVSKEDGKVLGYACFGPHSLTDQTYDLYWIAVDPHARGGGVGKKLLAAAEERMKALGARLVIVETSSQPRYEPTRRFYRSAGYTELARIPGYYKPGDDLVIYGKYLS